MKKKSDTCKMTILILLLFSISLTAKSKGKYEMNWDSLISHKTPEWLMDAKFGIYAHWGIYSVPAFGNEWYAKLMYDKKGKKGGISIYDHHVEKYGNPGQFGYRKFVPMFKAEKYDPKEWADLIKKSGAKFGGFAVVHHDGFLLWDSKVNRWNAGNMGPKRDLFGELAKELKKINIKVIATFHHIRTFDWYLPVKEKELKEAQQAKWDLFDPQYADLYWNRFTGKYEDFIEEWKAKVKEVADKYQPDVLWFDGGKFQEPESQHHVQEILSYYFNKADAWGKEVDVLNKLPTSMKFNFPENFGVLTFEEGRDRPIGVKRPWIDDMKISTYSWGYIQGQTYKSVNVIIDGLIDRVSRGGGLVLSLCPKADGTINEEQEKIMLDIGKWLKLNGEAIYGTRAWKIHSEGDVNKVIIKKPSKKAPNRLKWEFDKCDASDIRFTKKGDILYAICLGWPEQGELIIKSLGKKTKVGTRGISKVTLIGSGEVKFKRDNESMRIQLPKKQPCDHAVVFKIIPLR